MRAGVAETSRITRRLAWRMDQAHPVGDITRMGNIAPAYRHIRILSEPVH